MENYFAEVFTKVLLKLKDEINNFKNEDNIWRTADGITNPAGRLAIHLTGSLNFCIGNLVGNNGYVRNREEEFSITDVPREKIIADIDDLIVVVKNTLENIDQQKLDAIYPLDMLGQKSTTMYLTYFFGHLNYHLGQINYLRRILEKD